MSTKNPVTALLVPCNPPDKNIERAVSRLLALGHDVMVCPYTNPSEVTPSEADLISMMALTFSEIFLSRNAGHVLLAPKILQLNSMQDHQLTEVRLILLNLFGLVNPSFAFLVDDAEQFVSKISHLASRPKADISVILIGRVGSYQPESVPTQSFTRIGISNVSSLSGVLSATTQQEIRDGFANDGGVCGACCEVPQAVRIFITSRGIYGTDKLPRYDFPVDEGNAAEKHTMMSA